MPKTIGEFENRKTKTKKVLGRWQSQSKEKSLSNTKQEERITRKRKTGEKHINNANRTTHKHRNETTKQMNEK